MVNSSYKGAERRVLDRKIIYSNAILVFNNQPAVRVRTCDINLASVSAISTTNFKPRTSGKIRLCLPVYYTDRQHFETDVTLMYCIFKSGYGFRIGLRFTNLSDNLINAINNLMDNSAPQNIYS